MKIGIFIDTYEPQVNGVVTSTKLLKEELEELGHQVTIVTIKDPQNDQDLPDVIRLSSLPFPPFPELRIGKLYSYQAMKQIEELDLDIIHTQTEFSLGIFGRIMAKKLEVPIVHTYHTMYEDYMHYITGGSMTEYAAKFAQQASKLYCKDCDRIIAPTKKAKQALRDYGLDNEISVIPTGIKLNRFKQKNYSQVEVNRLRKKLGLKKEEPVVLYVGRLAEEKSIDVIIKELPKLLEYFPTAKFLVVGDGPNREALARLSRELGVEQAVIFAGEQPWEEIGSYYQLGDVFVSASTTETQGLTFIEAMAAQTPIVAKYDTNLDNLLTDQVNGRLFYEDQELASVVAETINNEVKTKQLTNQAYQDAQAMSAKVFGRQVEQLYYELVFTTDDLADKDLIWVI